MGGIVFFKTAMFEVLRDFYLNTVGCTVWLEQPNICIVRHGNQIIGICGSDRADSDMLLTFFYTSREEVDQIASKLEPINTPQYNPSYDIYHFYCYDPEGRKIEFQTFEHPVKPYYNGTDLLRERRSYRSFTDASVPSEVLNSVFEECRFSPTSRNCESYYYVVVRNSSAISKLAGIRGSASAPLGKAGVVIATVTNSEKTSRVTQDADIAGCYLLLALENNGLSGCWITDMDRTEVKALLDIPQSHHISMLTPVGYSDQKLSEPNRRKVAEFVKYVD